MKDDLHDLDDALAVHGLVLHGGFAPQAADGVPALPDGAPAAWLCLAGIAGSSFWTHFERSAERRDGGPDPLDRWSRSIGQDLAARFGAAALFPFDGPPYLPFQRWAQRAEPALRRSPLGLSIHPRYGLWHAFGFALAWPQRRGASIAGALTAASDLCASCSGQPCLHACPVEAFDATGYRIDACIDHLRTPRGHDCRDAGCMARRACPVAPEFRYAPPHAAFHMAAFFARHGEPVAR